MPRKAAGIEPVMVKKLAPGRYGDGGGLFLLVRSPSAKHAAAGEKAGGRFWLFRYLIAGKMREMGLGTADGKGAVSLKDARAKAAALLALVKSGIDPLAKREADAAAEKAVAQQAQVRAKTFSDTANAYIAAHEKSWRNEKHRWQWRQTLEKLAFPHMGNLPVAEVETAHVMNALEPIWYTKPETASRLRGRIEVVLDYAKARGWRSGENCARWRGHISSMLPSRAKVQQVEHHAALPRHEIGGFMASLRAEGGLAARALELAILTGGRTSEVLEAPWGEINLDAAIWTIPPERMKAKREHRVPLSEPALALLHFVCAELKHSSSEAASKIVAAAHAAAFLQYARGNLMPTVLPVAWEKVAVGILEAGHDALAAFGVAEPAEAQMGSAAAQWAAVLNPAQNQHQPPAAAVAVINELMAMAGLEEVKAKFLAVLYREQLRREQGLGAPGGGNFNSRFEGNPGTGKTTVARLYARLLKARPRCFLALKIVLRVSARCEERLQTSG